MSESQSQPDSQASHFICILLRKYFEDASKLSLGLKIHEYYTSFVKDVNQVHQEAVRLANIKKKSLEEKDSENNTEPTKSSEFSPGESVPQFAPMPQMK